MKNTSEIASEVRGELSRRRINSAMAARMLGVTQGSITNLWNGQRPFGSNVAKKWSDTFGFSVPFLVSGEGPIMKEGSGEQQDTEGVFVPEKAMELFNNMAKAISNLSETIRKLEDK